MKKVYTNPNAELVTMCTSDVIASSSLSKIVDDITPDVYSGAANGHERVY